MAILGRKKNARRRYMTLLTCYLITCVVILLSGFWDARRTIKEYNASQAKLVSGLLVENVNVALSNALEEIEEVSYAIAGGMEDDPQVIYNELRMYADRAGVYGMGFVDNRLNIYGEDGDMKDLTKLGYLKQAVTSHVMTVTDPFRSHITGAIVITAFVPVYKEGRRIGIVYVNLPLDMLQAYANMDSLNGRADIYLINCRSLNSITCSNSTNATIGTWNNLALRRAEMDFDSLYDYQFYIAKMQNGVKGDTVRYEVDGVDYTQGYERIDKMPGWYLAVELSDDMLSNSFYDFRDTLIIYAVLLLMVTFVAGVILIVWEVMQKRNFEKLSNTDAMTGLYNKKTFTSEVENYLAYEKKPGALIFVDVDDFKNYNDKYGHLNGDAVLKKFARELQEEFGRIGIVSRYGGDEFTVFLTNISGKEYVDQAMKRLQRVLAEIELPQFGKVPLSFSAGGATYPQDGVTYEDLCKTADDALYRVKADGKGKFYWY